MRKLLSVAVILLALAGCGIYSFKGQGIAGVKTVAVEPFDNRTTEFGIREQITEAVTSKLLADRTLTVTSPGSADAILTGSVLSVDDKPLTFHADETVTEYQITVTLDLRLSKPGQSEPIWQGQLVGQGSYPYKTGSADERKQGIDKAIDQIVQDLINRLTSDW
jgi:hypothetical protein